MNSSTADSEQLKETAECLHFKKCISYHPALFSGHSVYSEDYLNNVPESLF